MGFEEFQRQQKARKEAERQTKKATADLLAGYRGIGGDEKANEQTKKLAQAKQSDRIKKQATANLLAGYRGHGDEKINEQQRKFAEERLAAMIKKKSLLIEQLQKNQEEHSQQDGDDKANNTNSQGGKGVFVGGDVHGRVDEIQRRLAEQRLAEEEKAKRKLAEKQSRGFTIKRSKDEGGEEEEKDEEPVVQESNKDGEQDQPANEQEKVLEGNASGRVDQEGDEAQQPKEVLGGDVGGKVDEIQKKLAEQDVVVEKPKASNTYKKPPTIPKPNKNENENDDHRNTILTTPKKNPKTEKLPTITFKKLRRKKIKLDFTFGLIHDVVTPAPSHEECTAAAAEIVPNGMNGKKTSKGIISYDPNFPPIVTSIDVDPKFREPDQVRYTVKGKIPLYLIVVVEDDQDYDEGGKQETPPTPMTPSLQGILNRDESFRPNSALKKQQPSEVIVGEAGGSQWKRVREAAGEENLDELLKTKKVEEGESEVLLVQN